MTSPTPTTAAEDLVRLAASIHETPTLAQVDELLHLLSVQPSDAGRGGIIDGLLDMKALLAEAEAA